MPDFYTPSPVEGADYTGYSKGFKSSNAVGEVFEAAGDVLGMAVQATDNYYQGTIKEEARMASEQLLNDYGNEAAVDAVGGLDSDATPKEIQQGVNRLNLLKQAQRNGTLKESNFWAQAELISRQLKMRYPGYWEQIDSALSSQLGRKPALALQNELQAEREAAATKSDVERRQALAAARSVGLAEVFVAEQQGKPLSTIQINKMVADRNSIKWNQEKEARTFALKKSRNQATEDDADLAMRTEIETELTTLLNDSTSALFQNSQDYTRYANELERQRKSGGGIDPQVKAQAESAKASLTTAVNAIQNKYDLKYSSDLSDSKRKENLNVIKNWVDRYAFQIEEGDLKLGKKNTALLKATQDYNAYRFLSSNQVFKKNQALIQLFGEQPYVQWKTNNRGTKMANDIDIAIQEAMENENLLGNQPVIDSISRMMAENVKDPYAYQETVDNVSNAVTDEETPPIIKSNAIAALYGEKNLDFLTKGVSPDERLPMFLKLTAPSKVKEIKKLYDKGDITSKDFQKFSNWIRHNSIQLLRDNSSEINLISTNRKSLGVKLNPKTNLLEKQEYDVPFFGYENPDSVGVYEPEGSTLLGRYASALSETYQATQARTAVDNANDIIRSVISLLEATGEDPTTQIPALLYQSGINIAPEVEDKGLTGAEPAVKAIEQGTADAVRYLYEGFKILGEQGSPGSGQATEGLYEIFKNLGWTVSKSEDGKIIIDSPPDTSGTEAIPQFTAPGKGPIRGT